MTNPAGFANVRAHAQAHLQALATAGAPNPATLAVRLHSRSVPNKEMEN